MKGKIQYLVEEPRERNFEKGYEVVLEKKYKGYIVQVLGKI